MSAWFCRQSWGEEFQNALDEILGSRRETAVALKSSLYDLNQRIGIALFAVDEAHCVSKVKDICTSKTCEL